MLGTDRSQGIAHRVDLTETINPPSPPKKVRIAEAIGNPPEVEKRRSRPPRGPRGPRAISAEDIARLIQQNGYSGGLLRAVREARGLALQEVADTTRISVKYLEAVEADQRDQLPSATFVRGYVREMARLLELDVESVVAGYMLRFTGG